MQSACLTLTEVLLLTISTVLFQGHYPFFSGVFGGCALSLAYVDGRRGWSAR